jgi:hypothetical protein
MTWSIKLSKGKKGQLIQQLMSIKASIKPHRLDAKQYFSINSNMRYETVIDWVRKIAEQAWWDSDHSGAHKKHRNLFYRVKENCNWAHHTDNDPRYKYAATDSNQQQLVTDLRQLLVTLGVLDDAKTADDAADEVAGAMQNMHV